MCDLFKTKDQYLEMHLIPTVKYDGGSVITWPTLSSQGSVDLARVHCTNNLLKYQEMVNKIPWNLATNENGSPLNPSNRTMIQKIYIQINTELAQQT